VHHLQRAARRIRCLRHRDRGVVRVGEAGVVLRHLDGELRQAPLSVLAPDPLDRLGTGRSLASDDPAP